jgi:hypothetical protein
MRIDLLALSLGLVVSTLAACPDSTDGSSASPADGGVPHPISTSDAAASTDSATTTDGASTDGSGDAARTGDAGTIRVTLSRVPAPISGAPVVSHDANGAVVATFSTDANGNADLPAAGVDMVTVLDDAVKQAYTVVGVKGGDHIVAPTFAEVTSLGTLVVALPAAPANAVGFNVFAGVDFS